MIVRILSTSATFKGVNYNTDKVDSGKGELMQAANFGVLHGLNEWRPEDYKNYFKMVSAVNKRVKGPQFHAAISAKGKEYDKHDLTLIAQKWLAEMGYAKQPYLIVFHKDTNNNHVHIVSTRIARDGKKVNSGFENIRAVSSLNRIMGLDEKHTAQQDITAALNYSFSTKAQLMMILESQGYLLKENNEKLEVIKFGKRQGEIDLDLIEKTIAKQTINAGRKDQLKAIFNKYALEYDTSLKPVVISKTGNASESLKGYTSDFAACLKEKFGIVLIYHASADKPPYGYSVIDHAGKTVFKGREILSLKQLLSITPSNKLNGDQIDSGGITRLDKETQFYYRGILGAALHNYPDLAQGLKHQGLVVFRNGESLILYDPVTRVKADCLTLLDAGEFRYFERQIAIEGSFPRDTYVPHEYIPVINIADDVDDQQIFGPRRRRQKKARTNTR